MDESEVSLALNSAAGEVLETMFFATLVEEPPESTGDDPPVFVRVPFRGTPSGVFMLQIGEAAARTIAADFLGTEIEELTEAQIRQVMCEMANMVCGATLSHIDSETQFEISSPELMPLGDQELDPGVSSSMYLPNGTLTLRIILNMGLEHDSARISGGNASTAPGMLPLKGENVD